MTIRDIAASIVALFAVCASLPALAVEALSTEELISHCKFYDEDPEGVDGIFCVRYIQGFIDGAVATDERVTLNVAKEYDQAETITQRAIRNRLGSRMEQFGPSYYAEFCLGDPLPLVEVAKTVMKVLEALEELEGNELARDVVYATLRREYPCNTDAE